MAGAMLPVHEKLTMGGDTPETWCKGYFNASPGILQEDDILIPHISKMPPVSWHERIRL